MLYNLSTPNDVSKSKEKYGQPTNGNSQNHETHYLVGLSWVLSGIYNLKKCLDAVLQNVIKSWKVWAVFVKKKKFTSNLLNNINSK